MIVETGAGDGRALLRRGLRRGRRARSCPTPPTCGRGRHRLQGPRRRATAEVGAAAPGQTWSASSARRRTPSCCDARGRKGVTVLAMDRVPRISPRAEDGRAVVDGQHRRLPRRHRGGARTSAASSPARSPPPARCRRPRCSSIGAGVAGLAAIGTAVGLGAIVRANDTRPRSPTRSSRWAASSSTVDYRGGRRAASAATPR